MRGADGPRWWCQRRRVRELAGRMAWPSSVRSRDCRLSGLAADIVHPSHLCPTTSYKGRDGEIALVGMRPARMTARHRDRDL